MSTPGTSLYVNADWSALVPAGSPEAAFGITPADARRLGLLPAQDGETFAEPETIASANEPDPEAKMTPRPADKALRKPRNK